MKLLVAFLLVTISLACADKYNSDGQPGCKEAVEMEIKAYRNLWDPTAYWMCEQKGTPGRKYRCPDGEAWRDSLKACVDWDLWEWEELVLPPSQP